MTRSPDRARRFFSPMFIVSTVLLLLATTALPIGLDALSEYYSKEPIQLRRSLDLFDTAGMPSFQLVLGEGDFVSLTKEPEIETDEWFALTFEEKAAPAHGQESTDTFLFVTYYSDPRNQVAHTPEVCYRQGGATVHLITSIPVNTPDLVPSAAKIDAKLLEIEQGGKYMILLYVFYCNGRFYKDREQVRFAIGWPGDRYIYFSKIETLTGWRMGTDRQVAIDRCKRLLSEALTLLVKEHYPAREDVRRR